MQLLTDSHLENGAKDGSLTAQAPVVICLLISFADDLILTN